MGEDFKTNLRKKIVGSFVQKQAKSDREEFVARRFKKEKDPLWERIKQAEEAGLTQVADRLKKELDTKEKRLKRKEYHKVNPD